MERPLAQPPAKPSELSGIDPDRVFKFRSSGQLTESSIRGEELEVLAENDEWTYFVLVDESARGRFLETLTRYGSAQSQVDFAGTRSLYDTITTIDAIEPYGPDDRLDPQLLGATEYPIEVVIRVWPSASREEARRRVETVRRIIDADQGSEVLSEDDDPEVSIVVSSLSQRGLDLLSQTSVVERLTEPFHMTISAQQVAEYSGPERASPPTGALVAVLDDGLVQTNVLLVGVVEEAGSFPASKTSWQPPSEHGVAVASLAAFFDFEDAVRGLDHLPTPHPVVVARVVEPDPMRPNSVRAPVGTIFEQSVEAAIRSVVARGARVVNMSINEEHAPQASELPSPLTFTLDRLVSELDIVLVISAGNIAGSDISGDHILGMHVSADYPQYLQDARAAIAHPGGAATAITVGSIAHDQDPSTPNYAGIAGSDHPSPFTRTGVGRPSPRPPKPDLAHWGGNWAWNNHLGTVHIGDPAITSIVASRSGNPDLEPGHNGTSFAAPRVAHLAAEVLTEYPAASANLVRALLALSADLSTSPPADARRVVGWGRPSREAAIESGGNRAVMVADSELRCDTTEIHRIPIPAEYAAGRSRRRIRIAVAFDPPVRRERRDYTAGTLSLALVRAVDEGQALGIFRRQPTPQQRRADPTLGHHSLPQDRRRLTLTPSTRDLGRSTLIRAEWRGVLLDPADGEEYYLAISHHKASWTGLGDYTTQRYGIAVELVDEGRPDLQVHQLVDLQLRQMATARQRVRIGGPS